MTELVDSSVWIEFLRKTGSPAHLHVRQVLTTTPSILSITEPVAMELLLGATDERTLTRITQLTESLALTRIDPSVDFSGAAGLYRSARRSGRTVRKVIDCLIAAIAIRSGATLVHRDADYEVLASISDLQTQSFP